MKLTQANKVFQSLGALFRADAGAARDYLITPPALHPDRFAEERETAAGELLDGKIKAGRASR